MSTQRLLSLAIRWLLLAFAVWVAARIVAGIHLEGTGSTLAVALILGLLNLYLRPVLFLISLPLTILTLGLFIIVINAILLLLTDLIAGWFGVSFEVEGLLPAVLGAIIISIVNLVTSALVPADSLARRLVGGY